MDIPEDDSVEEKKPYKRLSDLEFAEARQLYEMGMGSLQEIATKFGITKQSLYDRFQRQGVKRGSRIAEALEKSNEAINDEAAKLTKRILETREQHYQYAEALSKLTMQTIVQARASGKAISTADADLAALNKAARTLEVLRRERYTLLGLDQDNEDPNENDELLITEMSPEDIAQLRDAAEMQEDNFDGVDDLLREIEVVEENDDA